MGVVLRRVKRTLFVLTIISAGGVVVSFDSHANKKKKKSKFLLAYDGKKLTLTFGKPKILWDKGE